MENKFTIRDFLVYILTGFTLTIFFIPLIYTKIFIFYTENQSLFKDLGIFISIISLLTFYLIGHIIQSLDLIKYIGIKKIIDLKSNSKMLNYVVLFFAKNRVIGLLYERKENYDDFSKKVYQLKNFEKFTYVEYWHSLKDLFHGLEIIAFIFIILTLSIGNFLLFGIYFFLYILFWFKSYFYSIEYVKSVDFYYQNLSK